MRYTVVWKPPASRALAELWTLRGDRSAITAAADEIEEQLAIIPTAVGESRSENTRLLIEEPLLITYEVHEEDRQVVVLTLRAL